MNNSCSNLRRAQYKVNKKETHFLVVKEKLTRLTLHYRPGKCAFDFINWQGYNYNYSPYQSFSRGRRKMPELSDQQLKDRVQKLENLLRVRSILRSICF